MVPRETDLFTLFSFPFPPNRAQTLEIVLESQEGDLEAAIDAMLQMCKDSEEVPSSSEASQPRRAVVSGFKGARPAVPVPVSVPDDPFAEPRNPVIERDDQIRADEMLARSMQVSKEKKRQKEKERERERERFFLLR